MMQTAEPLAPPRPARPILRRVVLGATLLGLTLLAAEALRVALGSNFHTIEAGVCYRSAQPSAADLRELARTHGIRTVINLRGPNPQHDWYLQEQAAARETGITLIDVPLSSNVPSSTAAFGAFVETLATAPRPMLLHCHSGADRTGLAAALFVLLLPGRSADDARAQISIRFGHRFWSEAGHVSLVLDAYEEWLRMTDSAHAPERFRHWANHVYREDDLQSRIQIRMAE